MVKKRARKKSLAPSLFTPPVADIGRTAIVTAKPTQEAESAFALSDGTKLYAKVIINQIERSLEKFNPNGEPIYQIQAGIILRTEVAKKLKRKLKKP